MASTSTGASLSGDIIALDLVLAVVTQDWFWEGSVQASIARFLLTQGWSIRRQADTASRERGVDLIATRDDRVLAIEVKGYPASVRTAGVNRGTPKPAGQANLQARIWYAEALLTAILLQSRGTYTDVAVGLPNHARYRALVDGTRSALSRLRIGIYLANEAGSVMLFLSHAQPPKPD